MAGARARFAVAFASLFCSFAIFAQSADLDVTKNGPPTSAADANVTYTILVQNIGPDPAASAHMDDAIPAGMTFVSVAPTGGFTCTDPGVGNNGTVSCSTASMASGASATI